MALRSITPQEAKRLIDAGAMLVDIRAPDEHAREHIPQSVLRPVDSLTRGSLDKGAATTVIFHCKSGARTSGNAQRLADAAPCEAFMLEGGLDAWEKAGLLVQLDMRQPLQ